MYGGRIGCCRHSLALFQAWLWFIGSLYPPALVLAAIAAVLIATALSPHSRLGRMLNRVWAPAKRKNESDRRYRLKMAGFWIISATIAYVWLRLLPPQEQSPEGELADLYMAIPLVSFLFLAAAMALQSILRAIFDKQES